MEAACARPGKIAALLFFCLVFPALAAAAPRHQKAEPAPVVVRIGAVLDQSAASAFPDFKEAMALAAEQMNKGLARAHAPLRFEIVFADSKGDPALALGQAKRLLAQEHVLALASDSSGDALAVASLDYDSASNLGKVPVTCFLCSSPLRHDPAATASDPLRAATERDSEHWLFRLSASARFEAAALTRLAVAKAGAEKPNFGGRLLIGALADPAHAALAAAMGPLLPQLYHGPTQIVVHDLAAGSDSSLHWPALLAGPEGTPNVLVLALTPEHAVAVVRSYRAAGYRLPLIASASFRLSQVLQQLGPAADGVEGVSPLPAASGRAGGDFLRAFHVATHHHPEIGAAGAYDAAATLMLAAVVASHGGSDAKALTGAAIRQGLSALVGKEGSPVLPTIAGFTLAAKRARQGAPIAYSGAFLAGGWDASGETYPELVHWVVTHGHFAERERFSCTPAEPLCQELPRHQTARHAKHDRVAP